MKTEHIFLLIAGVAIVGVGGYFYWDYYNANIAAAGPSTIPGSTPTSPVSNPLPTQTYTPTPTTAQPSAFPMAMGSRGSNVTALQVYLNTKFGAGLQADGIWGSKTEAAANRYLNRNHITQYDFNTIMSSGGQAYKQTLPENAKYGNTNSANI